MEVLIRRSPYTCVRDDITMLVSVNTNKASIPMRVGERANSMGGAEGKNPERRQVVDDI